MVWGWDQKNHVSKWREGWLEQRRRVVVFVCNPNQREAGPQLNWEKAGCLKKAEPVLWKESLCFANQQYLVIGEPLGGLEAGRFELVLKGLEQNVKYINTEYKKNCPNGLAYEISGISFFWSRGNAKERAAVFQFCICHPISQWISILWFPFVVPPSCPWRRGPWEQRDGWGWGE